MSAGIWMKIVLLPKEDLPSEGRVIEHIYALARIFLYIFSHKYKKCMYSCHSIKLPLLHPYCILN